MSFCSDSQHNNYAASAHHAHLAAHSAEAERAKRSPDSHRACAAPNAATCPHARSILSTGDIFRQLSECRFYFGRLSASEASRKLATRAAGTFLLRDSSDQRFLFAVSVQTSRGPTSVRLARDESGRFRLDCDRSQRPLMPTFASVVDLVQYYFRPSTDRQCVLVDSGGPSTSVPVTLTATLAAAEGPPSLAHFCRQSVHRARLQRLDQAESTRISSDRQDCVECFMDSLPPYVNEKAKTFLRSYPFGL